MHERFFDTWLIIQRVDRLENRVDKLVTRTTALEKFEHEVRTRENRATQSRNWLTSKVGMWAAIAVALTSIGSLIVGIINLFK